MHRQELRAGFQGSYKNAQGGSPSVVRALLVARAHIRDLALKVT
jgi:hypothetical protein